MIQLVVQFSKIAVLLFILPGVAYASVEQLPAHQHAAMVPSVAEVSQIGLTERLGEKLPLDLIFRDENGKPIRLGELITGPTIILPVYYKCTNVCNFLQGGLAGVLPAVKRKPAEDYRVLSVSFDETDPCLGVEI